MVICCNWFWLSQLWIYMNYILRFSQLVLSQCLDAVLVFANSHLMLNHNNQMAIIAAHTDTRWDHDQFLFAFLCIVFIALIVWYKHFTWLLKFSTLVFSQFIYPEKGEPDNTLSLNDDDDAQPRGDTDGKYELFSQVNNTVVENIKELILGGKM